MYLSKHNSFESLFIRWNSWNSLYFKNNFIPIIDDQVSSFWRIVFYSKFMNLHQNRYLFNFVLNKMHGNNFHQIYCYILTFYLYLKIDRCYCNFFINRLFNCSFESFILFDRILFDYHNKHILKNFEVFKDNLELKIIPYPWFKLLWLKI